MRLKFVELPRKRSERAAWLGPEEVGIVDVVGVGASVRGSRSCGT